jgi:hypothetical protein
MLYVADVPTCVACDELQRVEAKGEPLPEQQRKHHEARVLDLDYRQITCERDERKGSESR